MLKGSLRRTGVALGIAIAMAAGSASAATYNLTPALSPTPLSGTNVVSGSFADILNFDVVAPYVVAGGAVMDVPIVFGATALFNIEGMTVTLFDGTNGTGNNLYGSPLGDYHPMSNLLAVGDYSLRVAGTGVGLNGAGMYTWTAVAQPVPEPGEWAMLLAGFGLIGAAARRRRQNV